VHYRIPSGNPDGMSHTPGNANTALSAICLALKVYIQLIYLNLNVLVNTKIRHAWRFRVTTSYRGKKQL